MASSSALRLSRTVGVSLIALTLLPLFAPAEMLAAPWFEGHAGSGMGHPTVGSGYLGIAFHDVNDSEIGTLRLKDGHGAEIIMVDHDGPAGKAGLQVHDVVLSLNGTVVDGEDQLRRMLHEMQPGKTVSLYICRDGSERTVTATLANRADVERLAWQQHWTVPVPSAPPAQEEVASVAAADPPPSSRSGFGHSFLSNHLLAPLAPAYTGATVDAMGKQLAEFFGVKDGKGLLVHGVDGNSPAAAAGLRAGDVITAVNGRSMQSEKDWTRALHDSKGHPVSLIVVRDRHEQSLTMVPDAHRRSAVEPPPDAAPGARSVPVMMLR